MSTYCRPAVLFMAALTITACGPGNELSAIKEKWNPANDPLRFLPSSFERQLKDLPLTAELEEIPWSDTYWPTNYAGISRRWNKSNLSRAEQFKYKTYSRDEIAGMDLKALAKLSPAEKFDLLNDDYTYPMVKAERNRTDPEAASWEGLCHGWAAAALNFEEPKAVILTSPDGVEIPFAAADIKALVDIYSGNYSRSRHYFVAERCNADFSENPSAADNPECRDTNAGTFHLVLTNKIGLQKKGFVADVVRDYQVWNHPVFAFETRVESETDGASPGAAPGTVKEVTIKTTMRYVVETAALWNHGNSYESQNEYNYRLELNARGQIIGGAWLSDDRPDFLWMQERPKFANAGALKFESLDRLYRKSIATDDDVVNPAEPRF